MSENRIPKETLDAAARALKFQILALLNQNFAAEGISIATLAKRLEWSETRTRRFLQGKNQIRLMEIAEVLFAINGAMFNFQMVKR